MRIKRQVIVFDAADLDAESSFWAALLGGSVVVADDWHSVVDGDGELRIDVQLAPNYVPPQWPDGAQQQQTHLDLYVDDLAAAHNEVLSHGARLLQTVGNPDGGEGYRVYADPAGHPFCLCRG